MGTKERYKYAVAVMLLPIKDNKVLLSRRFNTGYADGNYGLVSGHADGNETFIQAMIREAKEESGVDISPTDLKFVHSSHIMSETEYVFQYYECKNWSGEFKNMEPNKCDDLSWFDLDNLPENTVSWVRDAIEMYRNGIIYSELN